MATELTKKQWIEILKNPDITKKIDLAIFQATYSFDGHKAYASQIGILLGYKGKSPHAPLNSEVGLYAKRISKLYDIEFTKRNAQKYKFWDLSNYPKVIVYFLPNSASIANTCSLMSL